MEEFLYRRAEPHLNEQYAAYRNQCDLCNHYPCTAVETVKAVVMSMLEDVLHAQEIPFREHTTSLGATVLPVSDVTGTLR